LFVLVIEKIWKQMTLFSKKEQMHPNIAVVFGLVLEPSVV